MQAFRGAAPAATALLVLLAGAGPAESWGFTAHHLVNRKAIATLPAPLRTLFEANADYVAEHAIDPDLWRGAGRGGEHLAHFFDMDAFGAYPFSGIPRDEGQHHARNGAAAAERGRIPWRIEEAYRDLVAAYRSGDSSRALERAAVLGHYVGDAHVPLHTTLNHDGQLTAQTGLHGRWESELVERYERQLGPQVRPEPARRVADPLGFAFEILRGSYQGVAGVLDADRACAGPRDLAETPQDDRYDDSYYSRLYEREGARLRSRLTASAHALGSLWLSAWIDAGRPRLAAFRFPHVRKQSRAVLVSLDGAAAPLVDDAVARGAMPQLARLRRDGATARGAITTLPSKTASGHAALFTGTWSDANGITGNEVAVPGASVLRMESGYTSTPLRAEPLWVTAARQGLDVTVAIATQVFPFTPFLEERRFGGNFGRRLTLLDGYRKTDAPDVVYGARDVTLRAADGWKQELPPHDGVSRELTLDIGGSAVFGLFYDDPADPARGFDTLLLTATKDAKERVTLKPRPAKGPDASAFAALTLDDQGQTTGVFFRLFALAPDASAFLLYRSRLQPLLASKPLVTAAAQQASGGFVGNGGNLFYERGAFGPPLWEGGDGTAERRYLETVALVVRQMTRLADFAIDRTAWDLLITYLPHPDEALHLWLGYLDPALQGHDAALAARLRPFLDDVLALCDGYVGHLRERAGNAILAVAADHGMVSANRLVRPNVALVRSGLVAVDASGHVDLARTKAVYSPGGYVLLNRVSRMGGIVAPEEEEAVRGEVVAALRALVDPATSRSLVTGILDPRDRHNPGIGGPAGGDLYLSLAPGYDVSAALTGELVESVAPRGVHFQEPERREMQAAFALAGPGIAAGADLGTIRQIDVAPTLAALLGIDPPAGATGAALTRALSRR